MKLSIAAAAIAAIVLGSQAAAKANDCAWAQEMGFGDLCNSEVSESTHTQAVPAAATGSVTICNDTENNIGFAVSSGPNSARVNQGGFLSYRGGCETVQVQRSEKLWIQAWNYSNPGSSLLRGRRSFCAPMDTFSSNEATTQDQCDRETGDHRWIQFDLFRLNSNGTKELTITLSGLSY